MAWRLVHFAGSAECTDRLKVDGGWLYRTRLWSKADGTCVALTFVPENKEVQRGTMTFIPDEERT